MDGVWKYSDYWAKVTDDGTKLTVYWGNFAGSPGEEIYWWNGAFKMYIRTHTTVSGDPWNPTNKHAVIAFEKETSFFSLPSTCTSWNTCHVKQTWSGKRDSVYAQQNFGYNLKGTRDLTGGRLSVTSATKYRDLHISGPYT